MKVNLLVLGNLFLIAIPTNFLVSTIALTFYVFCFGRLFRLGCAHFFYFRGVLKSFSFSAYSLLEYLVVPKRTEFCFCWESFHSLEVDGCGVLSSGEAAHEPVGVLPSASSFFSAFQHLRSLCIFSVYGSTPTQIHQP